MLDKTIYTVIIGEGYKLREPDKVCDGWNYVCYTDQESIKSSVWEIIPCNKMEDQSQNRAISRVPKICGVDSNISIYIDAKFKPVNNLDGFVTKHLEDYFDIVFMNHPKRNCVYAEADFLVKSGIEKKENITEQIKKYLKSGLPKQFGLFSPGIMIRRNNRHVQEFNNFWREEYFKGTNRDMISLSYAIWRFPWVKIGVMPFRKTYKMWMG